MDRINRYIFLNFITTFASLFSTLFFIMSIVFFIQIARVTSYIEITFFELLKLYLFMLPRVLLFVIPISFFVSLAVSLFRLSKENESIVIFTLGYSSTNIGKFFLKVAAAVSALLLIIAIILIPKASELNTNFINHKKTIAKLNLKGGEFGQKFSEWMVYINNEINDKNGTIYKNIVMYNPTKNANRLIIADSANISNENGFVELSLNNGKIYDIKDEIYHQSKFDSMKIRTAQKNTSNEVLGVVRYWQEIKTNQKRKKDLSTYILVALFPIASTLFALSFGIVTYRYDKGIVYIGTFGVLFGYFCLIMLLGANPTIAIPSIFLGCLISSFLYFKNKIVKKY